ncbi:MAG: hypothetical protein WAT37_01465 [Saprospiraceae bacterium]
MAILKGLMDITGTLDNLVYRKVNGKIVVSKTPHHNTAHRYSTRILWSNQELSVASSWASKIIRMNKIIMGGYSKVEIETIGNLTAMLRSILKKDLVNPSGQRTLASGLLNPESGYYYRKFHLKKRHRVPNTIIDSLEYSRASQILSGSFPFENQILWPKGVHHLEIKAAKLGLQLHNQGVRSLKKQTLMLEYDWDILADDTIIIERGKQLQDFNLNLNGKAHTYEVVLILFTVKFEPNENPGFYDYYENGKYNCSMILDMYCEKE